jgi:hypothetical protein
MRIGWACLATLAACRGGDQRPTLTALPQQTPNAPNDAASFDAASSASSPIPQIELVATDLFEDEHTRVRFATTGPTGIVVTDTISVPGVIKALAWAGQDPVVMLETGEVGRLARKGYERFTPVRAAQWKIPKPHVAAEPDMPTERFDTPRWRLIVDDAGAVWQARCDWGWDLHGVMHHCIPEGGRCDAWVYARVSSTPVTISQKEPTLVFDSGAPTRGEPPNTGPLPDVAPSSAIHAEIVQVPLSADEPNQSRSVVRCTKGGATIQYPTDDDRDLRDNEGDGVSELSWLSTTPPMFAVARRVGCLDMEWVVFEGCQPSNDYTGVIETGPQDMVAIPTTAGLSLRWRGQLVGTLDGANDIAFAPAR